MSAFFPRLRKRARQVCCVGPTANSVVLCLFAGLVCVAPAQGQRIRPLSKGWYRVPYDDGTPMFHAATANNLFANGHNGYDVVGLPFKAWDDPSPHVIVAMADGEVVEVEDGIDGCGLIPLPCTPNVGGGCPCNNKIWILHPNGEYSAYYHIAQGSAQVQVGDCVVSGQPIAYEGDVGSTGGGCGSRLNRPKRGCNNSQEQSDYATPDCDDPRCGMHLHFAVSTQHIDTMAPGVLVIPRICGIAGHVFARGTTPDGFDCNQADCPREPEVVVEEDFFDTQRVVVADNAIVTVGSGIIQNSVIGYEAGNHITLQAGFRAVAGCYFRASIGACQMPDTGCR